MVSQRSQANRAGHGWITGLLTAGLLLLLVIALTLRLLPAPDGRGDPLWQLASDGQAVPISLNGRLLEDPRRMPLPTAATPTAATPTAAAPTAATPTAVTRAAETPVATWPVAAAPNAPSATAATPAPPPEPPSLETGNAPSSAPPARPCKVVLESDRGRTELAFNDCPAVKQGWTVLVSGQLRRLLPAPHPLLAGSSERLHGQGVHTRLTVHQLQVMTRPPSPILELRRSIAGRLIQAAGAERGGLLAALVLGSAVVELPEQLREAFRAAGLSHALAASGFHLTVLLGLVSALSKPLRRPLRLLLAAGAMLGFLLLAGPQGSVVRAVLMGAVALLALECGWRARALPLLLITVIAMLLIQPSWLLDVGFQLSVAATAGLLISATPLEQAIADRLPRGRDGGDSHLSRILAPALAVPLAATLWTLPLQLHHFGVVPLYAVPANLAAGPLLTPLTLAAMGLALVAMVLPALLQPLLLLVNPLAWLLLEIARGFAGLPLAQMQTGRPLPLLVGLFALALWLLLLPQVSRTLRRLALVLMLTVSLLHLQLLLADQLLLVHQAGAAGGRDLLLARSRGHGGLISSSADAASCRQARRLEAGLGLARLDWLLLLDPVAAEEPMCWQQQSGLVVAYGDEGKPLAAGERLQSPGLMVEAISQDSNGLKLQLGRQRWLLLPDRQALEAWRQRQERAPQGVWLGFRPADTERRQLQPEGHWRWISGSARAGSLPRPWRASGDSGSLAAS